MGGKPLAASRRSKEAFVDCLAAARPKFVRSGNQLPGTGICGRVNHSLFFLPVHFPTPGRAAAFLLAFALAPAAAVAQQWAWAAAPATNPTGDCYLEDVALDRAGNTLVCGNFSGTLTLGAITLSSRGAADAFVARLSPTGQWLQAAQAGGTGTDLATGLALAADGSAVVVGSFTGTAQFGPLTLLNADAGGSSTDVFVARLTEAGVWSQALALGSTGNERAAAVAIGPTGAATVLGGFFGPALVVGSTTLLNADPSTDTEDLFVASLADNGTWQYAARAGGPDTDTPSSLALMADGTAVVAGSFYSRTASFGPQVLTNVGPITASADVFVARLSPTGIWTQASSAGGPGQDYAHGVAVHVNGTVTVAGTFNNTSSTFGSFTLLNTNPASFFNDVFVARLSPAGTWTQAVRAGGAGHDFASSVAIDAGNNATVLGSFTSPSISFGPFALANADAGGLHNDVFVARLDPAGQWVKAVAAGGPGSDVPVAIALNSGGQAVVVGIFRGTAARFAPHTLSSATITGFVASTANWLTATTPAQLPGSAFGTEADLSPVPNPAHHTATVLLPAFAPAEARALTLCDALGREVRRFAPGPVAAGTPFTMDLTGLAPGLYLLRTGAAHARLVVE